MSEITAIPNGWNKVKLKDLTSKIGSGITPKGGSDVFVPEGVMFIRSQNIRGGKVDTSDRKFIPEAIDKQMASSRVNGGDILYNITGASIGRTAVYRKNEPANVNQHVCIVRLKNDSPEFINYVLSSSIGTRLLRSFQAGGNREGLNFQQLGSFELLLPPRSEQDYIVKVLETWDEFLEKLDQKIEMKNRIKKYLSVQLFSGNVRTMGQTSKWQRVKLGTVSNMSSGGTPNSKVADYYGGDIPWVSIADMTSNGKTVYKTMKNLTDEGLRNSAAKVYPKGTILYAMYASIGECSIAGVDMASSQAILGIVPDKGRLDSLFLYHYLTLMKDKIKLQGQQGTQANLNAGMVRDFDVFLPSIEEQKAISNVLNVADDEIDQFIKQRELVLQQKEFLLNNLTTGKIRTHFLDTTQRKESQHA